MHLAQGGAAAHEGAGRQQFLVVGLGQGLARLPVAGHAHQGGAVVAPVLHELAGQLHRIPLHVVDAGGLGALHGGEHVLQAVAELVEQGLHLVEGHQARRLPHRRALVADQVGHRQHRLAGGGAGAAQTFVHPGAAALAAGAAEGVEVEGGQGGATGAIEHAEVAHIRVPGGRLARIGADDADVEQPLAEPEQALQHLVQREPGPQRLAVELKALLAQLLGPEGHIPGLQVVRFRGALAAGDGAQLLQLPDGHGIGGGAQVVEQLLHFGHRAGHLAGQAHLGPVGIAQPPGLFAPQRQDVLDQRPVVEFTAGGAGHLGAVHGFAQVATLAVFEERRHPRHVEPQQPGTALCAGVRVAGLLAGLAGCLGQQLPEAVGQAGHLGRIAQPQAPGVGGIEHVVAEVAGQSCQLGSGGIEGLLLRSAQAHTAELHVAALSFEDALLGGIELLALLQQLAQGPVDHRALARPAAEGHHSPLLALVGLAQLRGVAHAVEMAHHAPAPAQPLAEMVEGIHHLRPAKGIAAAACLLKPPLQLLLQLAEFAVELVQQLGDCRVHLFGRDGLKRR